MSNVTGTIKLFKDPNRGWVLVPVNLDVIKEAAIKKFIKHDNTVSVVLDMVLKRPYVEKTLSQLGYLHAAVWPVFYQYYKDQGEPVETQGQKEKVRDDVKDAIGFTTTETSQLTSRNYSKVRSFADASKEEATEAIDQIIRLAADFGMIVPGPEEYLEQHGAKDFI